MTSSERRRGAWSRAFRNSYFYPFHAGGTLVDIGCGLRPYEDLFAVDRYWAFDLPNTPRPPDQKRPHVWFDGVRVPVRDNSAEHVLCTAVLQYCVNPAEYVRELARVLKPGGTLVLAAPQSEPLMEAPFDHFRYTLSGLQELCAREGLRVEQAQASVGFWQTMAFHFNCMAVRSMLRRGRLPAMLVCPPLGLATQCLAAILDKFTAYDEDTNSWVLRAVKTGSSGPPPIR
jgi:SAM-dependent methyltransferase